ncbi:MAG: hypothetical protein KDJ52_21615, partial [Anaerolineae bacterium]|nr:hypothetical protein [Anaerolineae bacterium]
GNALDNVILGSNLLVLIVLSMLTVTVTTGAALVVGYKILKLPFSIVAGMVAIQPAVFTFVAERSKSHLPNIGFTMAVPIALIVNVIYAQLLYALLTQL